MKNGKAEKGYIKVHDVVQLLQQWRNILKKYLTIIIQRAKLNLVLETKKSNRANGHSFKI